MKIVFDVSQSTENRTGIENYFHQLTKAFLDLNTGHEITLVSNDEKYLREFDQAAAWKIIQADTPNFKWMLKVAKFLWLKRPDIFISQSNFMFSVLYPRTVQVVYDLGPFDYPQYYEETFVKKFKSQFKKMIARSKAIVCISETTKQSLIEKFPNANNKTHTIGSGLHDWLSVKGSTLEDLKTKFDIKGDYVLSVGTLQPRKNYINMIRAFAMFHKNNPKTNYVIVGKKGWMYDEVLIEAKNLDIEDHVKIIGYVDNDELVGLYKHASAFMNCSFFEGFGLPLVEAYSVGVPIVASDIPIYKEVVESQAKLVDPNIPEDIAKGLERVFGMKHTIDKEYLENYAWSKVAGRLNYTLETLTK